MTQGSFTPQQPPPPPPPPMSAPHIPKGFAVAALSTGIVAFVLGFVPLLSLFIGGAAIVLGIIALRKNQSRGMSWAGIITGALGALASILMTIAGVMLFDEITQDNIPVPSAPSSPSITPSEASASPTMTDRSTPSPTPTASETSAEPEPTPEPTPEESTAPPVEEEQSGTVGQRNALDSAQSYLSFTAFSRSGLIEQLEFEGYSNSDATWAVDNVTVDWSEQAIAMAESYLEYTAFSRSGLIDQLTFEGFSNDHAVGAVDSITVDWDEQAAATAESYLEYSSFSRSGLIDQLIFEGFTEAQAQYGVDQAGL